MAAPKRNPLWCANGEIRCKRPWSPYNICSSVRKAQRPLESHRNTNACNNTPASSSHGFSRSLGSYHCYRSSISGTNFGSSHSTDHAMLRSFLTNLWKRGPFARGYQSSRVSPYHRRYLLRFSRGIKLDSSDLSYNVAACPSDLGHMEHS
ncbi:hypothetical protein BU26DRAFT_308753 [Trematosphaeria pertusa]|uniref:Uncharacterized protein n=1 Tax=Trematosphaeria pertusa TaxID=390896 RepID=A0A6A6IEQ7_9PLEO|nr:uncharacterized protein BU26DRAFT_308753 [Trematosphaeria pertusa]KAF2248901.1 hypothetical protein BU26DRAFT_308753 [Trematosphaeria pertusa]